MDGLIKGNHKEILIIIKTITPNNIILGFAFISFPPRILVLGVDYFSISDVLARLDKKTPL